MSTQLLVTKEELAAEIRRSLSSIDRLRNSGKIVALKLGGKVLFDLNDVRNRLQQKQSA